MKPDAIDLYRKAAAQELKEILEWWMQNMPDDADGFHGSIDWKGKIDEDAPRGLVLYSRILWTFSAAYIQQAEKPYLQMAERAFNYLLKYFTDETFGGMYWSVNRYGKIAEDKKQVYGLAFAVYGLSEFYKATGNSNALLRAIDLYNVIEENNIHTLGGGYLEVFSRLWKPQGDLRLSEKDANEKKSMNTHLHVLEAYCNLYRIWKNEKLAEAIVQLLVLFDKYIIDKETFTQQLFFSEDWQPKSSIISYGHDIEASWLLYEAALLLEDNRLIDHWKGIAVNMARASIKGLDKDGGMWYEKEGAHLVKEKHWWPQAEAMVGYLNAWQLSNDERFYHLSANSFEFIKAGIKDQQNGEWYWGIDEEKNIIKKEKAGFWKCPYHNGRACMEIYHRLENIIPQASQSN
jgi:mannobiose 2-epimerase